MNFDPWHVTHSRLIGKGIELGGVTIVNIRQQCALEIQSMIIFLNQALDYF